MSVRGTVLAGSVVSFGSGELLSSSSTGYEAELLGQTFAFNFYWLSRYSRYACLVSTEGRNLGYINVAPREHRLFRAAFDDGTDLVVAFAANDDDVEITPGTVTGQFGAMLFAGVFE